MMEKLIDFKDEAIALKDLDINYFPETEIIKIAVNVRKLNEGKGENRLRHISREARRVMVGYNREIIQRDLDEN